MKKYLFVFLPITVALILSSCTSTPLELSQVKQMPIRAYKELPPQKESSYGFCILGAIPIYMSNRQEDARDTILKRANADDLINCKVSSKWFWTPIGSFYGFRLDAVPIKYTDGEEHYKNKYKELLEKTQVKKELPEKSKS